MVWVHQGVSIILELSYEFLDIFLVHHDTFELDAWKRQDTETKFSETCGIHGYSWLHSVAYEF